MTFRGRLKRVLTFGDSSSDDNATPRKGNPFRSKNKDPRLRDPNIYYQPGEKMPPLKYRRPVNPEHKAKLESFSWNNAWRRRSEVSQYSPMGSRLPSRRSSRSTMPRMSLDRHRSIERKSSRGNDGVGVDSGFGGSVSTESNHVGDVQENSEEENDVRNVGLSRVPTRDPRRSSSIHSTRDPRRSSSIHSTSLSAAPPTHSSSLSGISAIRSKSVRSPEPFSAEDLETALRRSHLDPTQERSDESSEATPGVEVVHAPVFTPVSEPDMRDIPDPPELGANRQPIAVTA